jgi:hypothetical protein
MHQALWALTLAILASRPHTDVKLIPLSNRVALRLHSDRAPEVAWIHICHPRTFYSRMKLAYSTAFKSTNKDRTLKLTHPVKVEITFDEVWPVMGGKGIKLNGRRCATASLFSATAENVHWNLTSNKACTRCGKKLSDIERTHIQLAIIARKTK